MREVDYIIIGCGLAGIAFCETLRANDKTFLVFDNNSQKSSLVAAGMYNPVILKRFSEVWKTKEQLQIALPVYEKIEKDLDIKIDYKLRLFRRFSSTEEQNLWFNASDKPRLEPYLSTVLIKNTSKAIDAPFGYGEVLGAGRIDTDVLIHQYKAYLRETKRFVDNTFHYENLQINDAFVQYEDIKTKHIVFAEGFGIKKNPYFKQLPLNGTKGEVITIKAPDLKIDYSVKSSVFIVPVGKDLYTVGATYNWTDKTNEPTEEGKKELVEKLKIFLKCDFEIMEHSAGVRPTVKDRRPLVGSHSEFRNLHILNGLGTRGVMIAPYVAAQLYKSIEHNEALEPEIDVNRFKTDH